MVPFPENLQTHYGAVIQETDSDALVIVFSPHPKPALKNYFSAYNTIRFTDLKRMYYTSAAGRVVEYIEDYVRSKNIRRVCFIGTSKGGYASLLWSRLLARRMAKVDIFCVAFSPQTKLWPAESSFPFPSYHAMINRAHRNTKAKNTLEKYGDINKIKQSSNLNTYLFYSKNYEFDRNQAKNINGKVNMIAFDLSIHGAIFPFITSPNAYRKFARKLFDSAKNDQDVLATLPASEEDLVTELEGLQDLPSLDQLVAKIIDHGCLPESVSDKIEAVSHVPRSHPTGLWYSLRSLFRIFN